MEAPLANVANPSPDGPHRIKRPQTVSQYRLNLLKDARPLCSSGYHMVMWVSYDLLVNPKKERFKDASASISRERRAFTHA